METKMKKKKKDLDFQIGDKVFDPMFGNGIVSKFYDNAFGGILIHFFDYEDSIEYSKSGILTEDEINGIYRTLYHGHDLEVIVKEKKPIRYPWVNIKYNPETKESVISINYDTKEAAIESIESIPCFFIEEPWIYIDTIQLIPNNLKEK